MKKGVHSFLLCVFAVFLIFTVSESSEEFEHPEVFLMDYEGNEILPESNIPYSPKNTCGECHDYECITNAYHFQQGRTDAKGKIVVRDDFDPKNPWFISHGMYGKW